MESSKRMTRAKRKRSFAPRPLPKVRTPEEIEQRNLEKRKKRRKKERLKEKKEWLEIKTSRQENPIQYATTDEQRAYFLECYQAVHGPLTQMEEVDEVPVEKDFVIPRGIEHWVTTDLESFLKSVDQEEILSGGNEDSDAYILILCRSAIRAIDLIKNMGSILKKIKVTKLFAKHKKMSEQSELLKKEKPRIAVGTPGRVLRLVEEGILDVGNVKYLIFDMERDSKTYHVLDNKELRKDIFDMYKNHVHAHVQQGNTKIVLF